MTTLPCETFEAAIEAVHDKRADLAMLPCENTLAGRVPDIHHLLPESGLFVIGEQFQRVEHCLLGIKGSTIDDIKRAHSHPVALGQVRRILKERAFVPVVEGDTAGSAKLIAEWGNKEDAAIASSLAAEIYGLEILRRNIEDASHNTTRFYVMAPRPAHPEPSMPNLMTTFVFRVRKLESYMMGGRFSATQFMCDVEGHPEQPALRRALEELGFFSSEVRILGVYKAAPFRLTQDAAD